MARGRPREFDIGEALDAAMLVFWRRGYEGASLDELTEAMGVKRPSLYAAFGSKEGLFRQALDRYLGGPASYFAEALEAPTAREVAETLLRGAAERLEEKGCMAVAMLTCGEGAEKIRRELCERRAAGEEALRKRFAREKLGDSAEDLARFVVTVLRGMAVQAAGGATKAQLRRVAEIALRAWPA